MARRRHGWSRREFLGGIAAAAGLWSLAVDPVTYEFDVAPDPIDASIASTDGEWLRRVP